MHQPEMAAMTGLRQAATAVTESWRVRTSSRNRVREAASAYSVGDNFERMALRRLIEDLLTQQGELTRTIMTFAGSSQAAGVLLRDAHEPFGLWIGKWPQQYRIHNAEDCRGGPDAERKRDYRNSCEARPLQQTPNAVANVSK